MHKLRLIAGLSILTLLISFTACSGTTSQTQDTQFSHMLKLVPYSFLSERDVWYSNQKLAKQIYGYEQINNIDAWMQLRLSDDELKEYMEAMYNLTGYQLENRWEQLVSLTGIDYWTVDSMVYDDVVPPKKFAILEGAFNHNLIINKLIEQGYQKVAYGKYSYYSIRDDFELDLRHPVGMAFLADLNQVAVLDDIIVAAPYKAIITGVLDTLSGKQKAVIEEPAGQALASSLGEVLSAVIMTPDRVLNPGFDNIPEPFDFSLPSDWGLLHDYDMAGMGHKDDGTNSFWIISLYYQDAEDASTDATILEKRLQSYIFQTNLSVHEQPRLLSDMFEVGQPVVQSYGKGATLTIECRWKGDTGNASWYKWMATLPNRDLLFLVPDPAPYVK